MAIHELNQAEINKVAGAFSIGLGTSTFALDLNDLLDGVQGTLNTLIDSLQVTLGGLLAEAPNFPPITIPGLGLTITLGLA